MEQDFDLVLKKILHYCSYQERCLSEVKKKLDSFDISSSEKDKLLKMIVEDGFVDDERYARIFVRSKLNHNKWGVKKIRLSLQNKGVANEIITAAMSEIDKDSYREELIRILKSKKVNEADDYIRRMKLAKYAIQKGFEPDLVWSILKEIQ
ncbi:MAG: RecX family transcriptional regulator [Bacteroidales bacterium]|nr:RecX family transcriptional regulator [Bacteroidales bacterium]